MDYLTIGQMAERNCVTKKALRLYHDEGLLAPIFVDESNGRRYYTADQCNTLDLIQRLQVIGMSLADIGAALNESTSEELAKAIERQYAILEKRQLTLAAARATAKDLLGGIRSREKLRGEESSLPTVQLTSFEELPTWTISCDELGIPPYEMLHHPCDGIWDSVLGAVKKNVLERSSALGLDIPAPLLFRKVGMIYPKKSHLAHSGIYHSVFIDVGKELAAALDNVECIPAGTYLSMAGECISLVGACNGKCAPTVFAERLFDYASRHRYKVDDCCYVETLIDPLSLRLASLETLFRVRLRVIEE